MKKAKIIIPLIVIVLSIGFVLFDSANASVEEAINLDASTGSTSAIDTVICQKEVNDIILCIYETDDGRFGYATVKDSNSLFNRYSICTIGNIDKSSLSNGKEIIEKYDKQNVDFTYGIIFNPNSEIYEYDGHSYFLTMCSYSDFNIGIFIVN